MSNPLLIRIITAIVQPQYHNSFSHDIFRMLFVHTLHLSMREYLFAVSMMASWHGDIFCVIDGLWGIWNAPQWIPLTNGQYCGALEFSYYGSPKKLLKTNEVPIRDVMSLMWRPCIDFSLHCKCSATDFIASTCRTGDRYHVFVC